MWQPFLRKAFTLFTALLLAFTCNLSFAAENIGDYFTEVWTSHDGLPHNSVNSIAQTEDGYLWFATWEGVVRYNGIEFKLFGRSEETGIVDAGIRTLSSDTQNRLWVGGARGGIALRQDFSWASQDRAPGLVNHVFVASDKSLWIAIEGEGVFKRSLQENEQYGPYELILKSGAARITQNSSGEIFVASNDGVYELSSGHAKQLSLPLGNSQKTYYVATDHKDHLLIATEHGAWRFDGTDYTSIHEALSNVVVTLIEEDDEGNLWLATLEKGLARVNYRGIDFLNTEAGLPNNRILSWFQDREGSIWIGTNGGILRLRNAPFINVDQSDGLVGDFVRTVLAIPGERFLVGTSNGLSILEDHAASPAANGSEARQSILSLANTKTGEALIGTQRNGVYAWRSGEMTHLLGAENGLPANEVRAILEDKQGRRWFGTINGVLLQNVDGTTKLINQDNSNLPDNYVMSLSEDRRGRIWIGTAEGVAYVDRRMRVHYVDISVFEQAQYVFGFYIEPGFVWMATDRGLVRYNTIEKTISGVGKPASLPIDKIFQVVYDKMGSFWLTSNRGVWKISYVEAHRVASGERNTVNFEHLGEDDGMGSSQANGASNPAAVRSRNGRLVFATAKGVSFIEPGSLKQLYQYRLPVVLESIDVDGQNIDPKQVHDLGSDVNRVRISFAGLSYVMSHRLQYQTKLVGFDENWNYHHNQTVAEYTNLPPGHYEFHVSARYPYGKWNEASSVYSFQIKPMFWQRTEVKYGASIILLLLVGALIFFRIHSLKTRQKELALIVEDKTKALREQAERFEKMSMEDPLTGLSNRRAFDDFVRRDFALSSKNLAGLNLAIIDIDHFKLINDRYSHLVGDEVIKCVGRYLQESIKKPNVCARWGGEEFTLILFGTIDEANSLCEKIRQDIAQLNCVESESNLAFTVSIGVANAVGCADYQTLLKRADHALYEAKENGRNQVTIYNDFRY